MDTSGRIRDLELENMPENWDDFVENWTPTSTDFQAIHKMIFIPNNVPSLKNSKTITTVGRGENKRPMLTHSKSVKKYLKTMGIKKFSKKAGVEDYAGRPNLFRESVGDYFDGVEYPAVVKFFFIRDSRRKFDFHNAVQIIADLLVAHGCLEDDNMDYFIPLPMLSGGRWYTVDKNKPGVWLKRVEI